MSDNFKTASLPPYLRPVVCNDLTRLGRDNDGGYLVSSQDIKASSYLLSFGINDDWSFEKDFVAINDVPVLAFDGSVDRRTFRKDLLQALPFRPRKATKWWKTLRDYDEFFQGERVHRQTFVGMHQPPDYVAFSNVVEEIFKQPAASLFCKIDVEGWEYRFLDEIIQNAQRFAGIVIEFHDLDLHSQRVEQFVRNFPLVLVHTHCNNCAPLGSNGLPLVVECTFSAKGVAGPKATRLPHALDQSNQKRSMDYAVRFL